jgi:hypothetical protein
MALELVTITKEHIQKIARYIYFPDTTDEAKTFTVEEQERNLKSLEHCTSVWVKLFEVLPLSTKIAIQYSRHPDGKDYIFIIHTNLVPTDYPIANQFLGEIADEGSVDGQYYVREYITFMLHRFEHA